MGLHIVHAVSRYLHISVPKDALVAFAVDDEVILSVGFSGGRRIRLDRRSPGVLYHGSSQMFDVFKGSNHFFTEDIKGALAFGVMGLIYFGARPPTPSGGFTLYTCRLKSPKVQECTRQQMVDAGLDEDGVKPKDQACQRFMKDHPDLTALHFTGVDDLGVDDVWFTDNPRHFTVAAKQPYFVVSVDDASEVPKVSPTTLRVENAGRMSMTYRLE